MKRLAMFAAQVCAIVLWITTGAIAVERDDVAAVREHARGAQRVVVAKAVSVVPQWQTTTHGDMLIVSKVALQVEETLKGEPVGVVWLDVEGGTIDGMTLVVSSQVGLKTGERAVFFLDETASGRHVPHLKGKGIMKLDEQNRIQGSALELNEVRRLALSAGR